MSGQLEFALLDEPLERFALLDPLLEALFDGVVVVEVDPLPTAA